LHEKEKKLFHSKREKHVCEKTSVVPFKKGTTVAQKRIEGVRKGNNNCFVQKRITVLRKGTTIV
jgi:hypothetical protein